MGNRLRVLYIESGSKGNCAIVESDRDAIVIDCGITKRAFASACSQYGVDLGKIRGIFLTHCHSDHVKGVGVVLRHLQKHMPVMPDIYATKSTYNGSSSVSDHRTSAEFHPITRTEKVVLGELTVHVFPTSHDARGSVGFAVSLMQGNRELDRYGHITDTGYVTPKAFDACAGCRILGLESNHDVKMLREGPYPYVLKVRVGSDEGHLSNDQSAEALIRLLHPRLETVVALHLSENNNTPELAHKALCGVLAGEYEGIQVYHAYQGMPLCVR